MKKRTWVIGGSVGAGVILVLASLIPIVNAQTTFSIKSDSDFNGNNVIGELKFFHDTLVPGEGLWGLMMVIWDTLISWFLWFYVNIWLNFW